MSTKKQWIGKEKLAIVLQGVCGERSVSELCNAHGLTQSMDISGAVSCFADGAQRFDRGGVGHVRDRLEPENCKLKETIGELTIEL